MKTSIFNVVVVTMINFIYVCSMQQTSLAQTSSDFRPRVLQQKIDAAVTYVRRGMPFTVEIDPFGAIVDDPIEGGELEHLKTCFLIPLAHSPYERRIQAIKIDAGASEWTKWTCVIELKDNLGSISLTHYSGFYDGKSNADPDGYKDSRQYVMGELKKIGYIIGWDKYNKGNRIQ